MRTVVVSGSAGSGTSSVAAALAIQMASRGERVALLRSDRLAPPVPEAPAGLRVIDIDPLAWAQSTWEAAGLLRRFAGPPWSTIGGTEVLLLPGMPQAAWWWRLREAWREPNDLVVVDAGPIDTAFGWLTLPDTIGGSLRRAWPIDQRSSDAAGGLDTGSWHVRALARLDSEAADLADRMRSASVSVHLVARPNRHDLARILYNLAPLALFEFAVTDLVLNHVSKQRPHDAALAEQLARQMPQLRVRQAAAHRRAPVPAALAQEVYAAPIEPHKPHRPRLCSRDGGYAWRWRLPFADPGGLSVATAGEDAVLTVAGVRRVLPLPSVLRRCLLQRVEVSGGDVDVVFAPNPDLWPETWELR